MLQSDDLEALYELGFGHYEAGEYRRAKKVFHTLVMAHPMEKRHWEGYAASLQMQQKYDAAIQAWAVVAMLDAKDPTPHVSAAECYLALGNVEEGKKGVRLAKKLGAEDGEMQRMEAWIDKMTG